jgi:hypothetical protein
VNTLGLRLLLMDRVDPILGTFNQYVTYSASKCEHSGFEDITNVSCRRNIEHL